MPRRYWAIAALCFGTALVVLDGAIPTVALPTIARDLKVGGPMAVLVVTVYQLVLVMSLLPLAHLGDRIGHRRLYQSGQLVFTAATLLCVFANSLPMLLAIRVVQALGAACALSVTTAMIRTVYPSGRLGRGLGVNSVVVHVSSALAPSIGGLILGVAAWPWIFASAVPFAALSLALGAALPESEPRDEPFDVTGAVLCAAMFGLVISGLETAVHRGAPWLSAGLAVAGVAIGIVFVRRERTVARPILPIDLLARPVIGLSVLGSVTAFIASMVVLVSTPFRLQHAYGFTPAEVGAAIAPWPLGILVAAPTAGALSDRFPAGLIGALGMLVAIAGLLALAWPPIAPHPFAIAWRMAICGAGFGMFVAPNGRLIIGSAPRDRAAAAGGLVGTTRMTGQTVGASLTGLLLSIGLGVNSGAVLFAAGLALLAAVCSLIRLAPVMTGTPAGALPSSLPSQG